MNKALLLPAAVTLTLGLTGTGLVLYAWQLPPFAPAHPTTENAYVRGQVTTLSPQIAGYIGEVLVKDFQEVKAGDLLIKLDDASQSAKLEQAQAGLAMARANLHLAQKNRASLEQSTDAVKARVSAAEQAFAAATAEFERQTQLSERGVQSMARREQAQSALSSAEAQLAEARANLSAQVDKLAALEAQIEAASASIAKEEANVALAQLDLDHTEIHAPSDGQVGQITARIGQYVTAGTALASHVGAERWVIANFTETDFNRLHADQPVRFTVDALSHRAFEGHISRFSPAAASEFSVMAGSNTTGNFTKIVQRIPVRIELETGQDFAEALLPGMSVVVEAR